MRPRDKDRYAELDAALIQFAKRERTMPGIAAVAARHVFVEQILESIHRITYIDVLLQRGVSAQRANPRSEYFDPLKAAIYQTRSGNMEEAIWLVFLFVHFGKHRRGGWRYAREVYGRLDATDRWSWSAVSADPTAFREWLREHRGQLGRPGSGFGNHRKRESLDAMSSRGTGAAVETYVQWVAPPRSQRQLIQEFVINENGNEQRAFDALYNAMDAVASFGRTARFDFLTMLAKLQLASISPGLPYLKGATGPLSGARKLFGSNDTASSLEPWLVSLAQYLQVGMQVIEDALCNWQKSPGELKRFRG